jgi:hypothetical protein
LDGRSGVGLFISVTCAHCEEPFVFPGFPGQELPRMVCGEHPSASPDHTLVRLPMYARSDAPEVLEPERPQVVISMEHVDITLDQVPDEFKQALGLGGSAKVGALN